MMHKILIGVLCAFLLSSCTNTYNLSKPDYIKHLIQTEYIKDISDSFDHNESIPSLMQKLDAHSIYLSPLEFKRFLISTNGKMGGIGIALHMHDTLLTVITPIQNTPAQLAGIQSGDIILRINNTPTLGLTLQECISLTKGKVGTYLNLTVLRKETALPLYFHIKRQYINTNPIYSRLIDNSLLYIHITSFNAQTNKELNSIFKKYPHKKGIILDLRYNPGGRLDEAVSLVNRFIDKGIIVSKKGRSDKYTDTYYATFQNTDTDTPIAILINKGSASASEIVAGSLKSYKRATIIGEKSFGKGTVQTLFPLSDLSALKLTIAKYYLPNGKSIDKVGVKPDFTVHNKIYTRHKEKQITLKKAKEILKKIQNRSTIPKVITQKNNRLPINTNHLSPTEIKKDKQLQKAIRLLKNSN